MLVKPAGQLAIMEVDTDTVGTNGDDVPVRNGPNRWDYFCDDFADVFKPPGFPSKCNIKHNIGLLSGATP